MERSRRRRRPPRALALLASVALAALATTGCGATRPEGLDPGTLPADLRADYELFANRCSRCHTLARPLNARITDESHWRAYVRRMRRQPGSGISPADEAPLLRFLMYYGAQRRTRP